MRHHLNQNVFNWEAIHYMTEWSVWIILASIFFTLVIIQLLVRSKKPIRKAISGILTGLFSLFAVNLLGIFTNVTLPISLLSLGISAVAGIPGVTMLLLLKMVIP